MNIVETPNISELAEVLDLKKANESLAHGWVFIRCLATLRKVEDGKYSEIPLYILVKPKPSS